MAPFHPLQRFLPQWNPSHQLAIHLQWFASAEEEGRTEEATEAKIRKSREEGKVAKSVDIVSASVLLLPVILIGFLGSYLFQVMLDMLRFFLTISPELDITNGSGILVQSFYSYFLRLIVPVALTALAAAVASNVFQVGWLFTFKPLKPDFSKIIPKIGKWLQKVLFSPEAAFNLLKSILKIVIILVISLINIQGEIPKLVNLIKVPFLQGIEYISGLGLGIIIQAAVVLLALAIPDFLFQRWQHRESIKMSKPEIKEERKQQEGDPLIKGRLRERQREVLMNNMMQNVPKADVIITNPTHFAVGLQWNNLTMAAPTVIAKGSDEVAQKIKEVARENEVPVVENKPLARALFAAVKVGDQVPEEYWEIVSRVLAEVYKLNGKMAAVAG